MCNAFDRKGVSNRMFLSRKLLKLKMKKEDDELEANLFKFDRILRSLKSVESEMEEKYTIC